MPLIVYHVMLKPPVGSTEVMSALRFGSSDRSRCTAAARNGHAVNNRSSTHVRMHSFAADFACIRSSSSWLGSPTIRLCLLTGTGKTCSNSLHSLSLLCFQGVVLPPDSPRSSHYIWTRSVWVPLPGYWSHTECVFVRGFGTVTSSWAPRTSACDSYPPIP